MSVDWSLVTNVASVVGTVGGLLFVWWQVRQIREVNAYGLLRDEVKRWNSPEMRPHRARLAQALLVSRRDFERIEEQGGEEVTAYFEDIGLLLRRRVVPVYYVWSMRPTTLLTTVSYSTITWPGCGDPARTRPITRSSTFCAPGLPPWERSEPGWRRCTRKTTCASSWRTKQRWRTARPGRGSTGGGFDSLAPPARLA